MMAWKRRRTSRSVDVDLDDFADEELLQGLIDSRWISEAEAEAIALRAKQNDRSERVIAPTLVTDDLCEATEELRRGRVGEAKLRLERYLGRDWFGVLGHG